MNKSQAQTTKKITDQYILNLLETHGFITPQQREQIILKKNQQRHTLLKRQQYKQPESEDRQTLPGIDDIDIIDIIVSLNFLTQENPPQEITEEMIMRLVAKDLEIPFKKLDPLDLDLKIVTQTIPKTFAMNHLLLPFEIKNGILSIAIYDPAKTALLPDIERANQITIKPYLSTKSNIQKIQAEFFGFQSSITAAESSLAQPTVDIEKAAVARPSPQ